MLVVVIVNPQGSVLETETRRNVERDVLIPAAAAGKWKTECLVGINGLQTGTRDLEHVGFEGTHEGFCCETLDMEPDYEIVVFGGYGTPSWPYSNEILTDTHMPITSCGHALMAMR